MDSLKSVWQSILDEIAKNITSTAYNTWFSDCEPVELGETSLIIQTTSDFKRSVIQGRFGDVIRVGAYIPTPDVIIEETARYFSITSSDIRGQRRSKNVAKARQVSMYLIRNLTNLSLVDIGSQYEGRNHSTVLTSIRKIEELIKTDQETSATVRDISSNINSRS